MGDGEDAWLQRSAISLDVTVSRPAGEAAGGDVDVIDPVEPREEGGDGGAVDSIDDPRLDRLADRLGGACADDDPGAARLRLAGDLAPDTPAPADHGDDLTLHEMAPDPSLTATKSR